VRRERLLVAVLAHLLQVPDLHFVAELGPAVRRVGVVPELVAGVQLVVRLDDRVVGEPLVKLCVLLLWA